MPSRARPSPGGHTKADRLIRRSVHGRGGGGTRSAVRGVGQGTGPVTVCTTPTGCATSSAPIQFTYNSRKHTPLSTLAHTVITLTRPLAGRPSIVPRRPAPRVEAITPDRAHGAGGTPVNITGDFGVAPGAISVTLDDVACDDVRQISPYRLACTSPEVAVVVPRQGAVVVTTETGGQSNSNVSFYFLPSTITDARLTWRACPSGHGLRATPSPVGMPRLASATARRGHRPHHRKHQPDGRPNQRRHRRASHGAWYVRSERPVFFFFVFFWGGRNTLR